MFLVLHLLITGTIVRCIINEKCLILIHIIVRVTLWEYLIVVILIVGTLVPGSLLFFYLPGCWWCLNQLIQFVVVVQGLYTIMFIMIVASEQSVVQSMGGVLHEWRIIRSFSPCVGTSFVVARL